MGTVLRFVVLPLQRPRLSRSRLSCGRIRSQPSSRSKRVMASALGSVRSCASRATSRTQGSSAGAACACTCGGGFGAALAGRGRGGSRCDRRRRARFGDVALEQALHLRAQPRAAEFALEARDLVGRRVGTQPHQTLFVANAGIAGLQRRLCRQRRLGRLDLDGRRDRGRRGDDHAGLWRYSGGGPGAGMATAAGSRRAIAAGAGAAGAGAAAGSTFFATAPGATRAIVEPPSEP